MADRPKKFIKGHNALKGKSAGGAKQLSKAKEFERKKAEEAETAAVLNEYIADFQTSAAGGKTFVRAGVNNQGKLEKSQLFMPGKNADEEESPHYYKPKSRMQELADEFKKSKEITEEYKSSKQDLSKKKGTEKKKSNLELFKEELEKSQTEREIRRKLKKGDLSGISEDMLNSLPPTFFKPKATEDEFGYQYEQAVGSRDTGDPATTNLFISNINPKMNEEQLCKVFGKYGPLASVKIMWPRTEEEKLRNRNCGFVAYMTRHDGESALKDIEGKDVMDYEMKIGWGKAVPIPPLPIYVHPSQSNARKPPKQSGLPFNCRMPRKLRKQGIVFDGNLENTVIKVVIPTERTLLSLINRVVEFVVREGPMFEAMIMNREIANQLFRFLFDNKSNEHIYYRWRVFSLLQGDTTSKWSEGCFRMFVDGSIWQPPPMNPFGASSSMTTSAALASASSANVHHPAVIGSLMASNNEESPSLAMKKNFLLEQLLKDSLNKPEEKKVEKEKEVLSDKNRDRLEDMLRTVSTDRTKIGELMLWCIDHAECSEEIVECICESLSIPETPLPTKIARLFVVNDILHNASAKVHNASNFRKAFQDELLETMENLHEALTSCSTKSQTEKFRKQVLSCLAAWQDWSVYPPGFLINLQNVFVGISTSKHIKLEEEMVNKESQMAKIAASEDADIDGIPLSKVAEDVDGVAMADDDIDGIPLTKETSKGDLPPSRWETDTKSNNKSRCQTDKDDPISKSRWQNISDEDENEAKSTHQSGKWEKVEGLKEGKNSKEDDDEEESVENVGESRKRKLSSTPPEVDEDRRKFLRDVEVKVMRFVDKLEQRGASRSGLNIQKEAEKFRQQLIEEYDMARIREQRRKVKSERKKERSNSPTDSTKRRKSSKQKRSYVSDSDSDLENNHRNTQNTKNKYSPRYSPRRSRSFSQSPPPRSPIFSDRSRSPYNNRSSPLSRDYSRRSRSFTPSPKRFRSPRSPVEFSPKYSSNPNRSPRYSPPSPKRLTSAVVKSAKKKKSKKNKR